MQPVSASLAAHTSSSAVRHKAQVTLSSVLMPCNTGLMLALALWCAIPACKLMHVLLEEIHRLLLACTLTHI